MKEFLPCGRPSLGAEEARRMAEVLESDWLTQGPKAVEFEDGLNRLCHSRNAMAVSHGTTALYLACRAAGLGPGDRFLTSPIAFLATANAGLLCGAEPVFADIEADTFNLDPVEVPDPDEGQTDQGRLAGAPRGPCLCPGPADQVL